MKIRNRLTVVVVYLAVIASMIALASLRSQVRGAQTPAAPTEANPQPSPAVKPRFSLSTNRAYGVDEKARIYIGYQGIDSLDFRVYEVKDPFRFFRQLNSAHQMGIEDRSDVAEVAATVDRKPSLLEKLRSFKTSVNRTVKNYFRGQLRRESRAAFNDKFRAGEQLPLNEADFARVPLLNPDQLVGKWKQLLEPTIGEYDTRMISLGQQPAGVYLIEAVNGDLRAYSIAVVTDITMINKTTRDGQMLVYVVDRKSGEPRAGVQVEVVKNKRTVATGTTDGNGVLKVSIRKDRRASQDREAAALEPTQELEVYNSYVALAKHNNQFAVSDLPYYYESSEGEDGAGEGLITSDKIASYIYTDRPVYRPEQKVYFKGIVRILGDDGYKLPAVRTASVKISDQNRNEVFSKELPISARGTYSGEFDLPAGVSLGQFLIEAEFNGAKARGSFEVAEYKKPEFKVKVSTPKSFTPVGEKTRFTIDAKYFSGGPVTNGDVTYRIYRSRYYHWWFRDEYDDGVAGGGEGEEGEGEGDGYYGYGNDMLKQGEGRLNAQGRLEVAFDVPPLDEKQPYDFTYRLEAQVTDTSRRMMEGKASFVGTRGKVVVFARPDRYVYYQNENSQHYYQGDRLRRPAGLSQSRVEVR